MKLLIMSDLHLEFEWPAAMGLPLPPDDYYDAVVLAGDIHLHTQGVEWAAQAFRKHVIYVTGNHEFYGASLKEVGDALQTSASKLRHLHLLDNATVTLVDSAASGTEQVRFIGATLWTDFKLFGATPARIGSQMQEAKSRMRDFGAIRELGGRPFEPADSVRLFNASAAFIGDELRKPFDGKTVVVTHHLPSVLSVVERHKHDLLSAAFASHLDDHVRQADLWVHGHTHDRLDYRLGKCRVVCHPRGYPSEQCMPYAGLIVEI